MINYQILSDSIDYYSKFGFRQIETPWTITESIAAITKPKGAKNFSILEKNKVLVASAEQGFLYLYNKGFLPKGRFQSISPCFREEPFDSLHSKYFIKNELIDTENVNLDNLINLVNMAKGFFEKYLGNNTILIENTSELNGYDSYDLTYKDIELGSYGIRKCQFLEWVYGTGVAEPRLSRVIGK